MRILWCITGGGHLLEESCKTIEELAVKHEITIAYSRAGREVIRMYNLSEVEKCAKHLVFEETQGASSPIVGKLGKFDTVVISPCTANTMAKIAYGIADSLVTNIAAQSLKTGKNVVVVPTDMKKSVQTKIPSGKFFEIKCREIDLENVKKLKKMRCIKIAETPGKIKEFI